MAFDKDKYDRQYKKDNFDNFSFYAPKGLKEQAQSKAESLGMKLSEYLRYLIEEDTK